jgi:hypothetical protein
MPEPGLTSDPEATPVDTGEIHRAGSGAYERTWELELLISGAVTFALLQLPAEVDRWFFAAEPAVVGNTRYLLLGGYEYAKFILYALIPSFIVHLAARAYWVGLIGLDSVFPHGVRWEKLGRRPITRVVYRERQPSIEALIRNTDRFCSVIFSFAFSLAFLFLFSIAAMVVLWLAAFGVSTLLFDGENFGATFAVIALVLFGPVALASALDKTIGHRLDASRGLGRVLYQVQRLNYTFLLGIAYFPTINVLASNIRKGFYPLFYGALAILIGVFLVKDIMIPTGALTAAGYEFLPDRGGAFTLDPQHYAELRRPREGFERPVPFIQAQAIRDPYVRLFLPYTRRHTVAMRRECPGLRPLAGSGPRMVGGAVRPTEAEMRALYACLERVQPVFLGGAPLTPAYRLSVDPQSDLRGIVAFIPTAGLPPGENELVIPQVKREGETAPPDTFHIAFWVVR